MTEQLQQTDFPEITPVREAHRIDEARLAQYLSTRVPGAFDALEVRQFEGGQSNPTYLLDAGGTRYVMRKKPPGELLKSAHQVDREYRVMSALADRGVPVPKTYLLCEDDAIVGTPFFLMEHVDGRVMTDPWLRSMPERDRAALYDHFIEVLAAIHGVDLAEACLEDYGRAGNYYERQIGRWTKQYKASETQIIPAMDALMEWLPAHIPDSDETTLVHGDYRIGNCIVHPTEPRLVAVLDWELSTTGHPLGDVGYACMIYRPYNGEEPPMTPGVPAEAAFVRRYSELSGRDAETNWTFYVVFNLFRSAAIVQGVYKRGLDGNASSEHWRERSDTARQTSELAWQILQNGT